MALVHIADISFEGHEERRFVSREGKELTDSGVIGSLLENTNPGRYTKYRILLMPYDDSAPAKDKTP